ncbi:MAG: beta strand repeat-containing protein, partial [Synechococcaceae cyanobacterium]
MTDIRFYNPAGFPADTLSGVEIAKFTDGNARLGTAGADSLTAGATDLLLLGGDGNDTLDGGAGGVAITGGAGDDDIFFSDSDSYSSAVGDDGDMTGAARGGNDTLQGRNGSSYSELYGDALGVYNPTAGAAGGDDVLTGGNGVDSFNFLIGDANDIYGYQADAIGNPVSFDNFFTAGNDSLTGGDDAFNLMSGDAASSVGSLTLGNDTLTGGAGADAYNYMVGDVDAMETGVLYEPDGTTVKATGSVIAGNDVLTGGAFASNEMYGDASAVIGTDGVGHATLGDDTLTGGADGTNTMYGDAVTASGTVVWGNDRLVSGARANDVMWGDATNRVGTGGTDTFVFAADNGQDTIGDFEIGHDKIDLTALPGASEFDALTPYISEVDGDTVIDIGLIATPTGTAGVDTVTLTGVTGLTAADFVYAPAPTIEVQPTFATGTPSVTITATNGVAGRTLSLQVGALEFGSLSDGASSTVSLTQQGSVTSGTLKVLDSLGATKSTDAHLALGTGGADTLNAAAITKRAAIYGFDGNDAITGGSSADTLDGGAGDDTLSGGAGDDSLDGGTGNDTFTVDAGSDTVTDLSDSDVLVVSAGATANATVTAAFTAGAGTSN